MIQVLQIYDSLAVSSGISSVILGWFNYSKNSEVKMDFLCSWKRGPSYDEYVKNKGSNVWYISETEKIKNFFCFIRKVDAFFRKHANEYDIVHLHSATFAYPYLYFAKKYGIKTRIVHVHSSSLGNTSVSSKRNKFLLLPLKKLANCYIACSDEAADVWYKKRGINDYRVLPNGIETKQYVSDNMARVRVREELRISNDEYVIGHISNMNPIKNVAFLIGIAKKLVDIGYNIKLVFVGKDAIPHNISSQLNEVNLTDKVINVGVRTDVNKLINAFDICLMPSFSEGYGLVPVEVQTVGVPVIMSEGFPKIVCFSENAKRLPLENDIWVKEIEKYIRDGFNYYKEPDSVINNYDVEQIANELFNFYRDSYCLNDEGER